LIPSERPISKTPPSNIAGHFRNFEPEQTHRLGSTDSLVGKGGIFHFAMAGTGPQQSDCQG